MDHGQYEGWGGRMGGRSSSWNHCEEFPNSQAAPLRIENWKQNLGREWWLGNYNHPDQLVICPTAAPAWQWAFWLSGAVITHWKLGLSFSSKDPWNAAVNQHTGHQGSLDILKMCFRYLGNMLIHWCILSVSLQSWNKPGPTGHVRHHLHTWKRFIQEPGPESNEWSLSCCLTWRWRKLEILDQLTWIPRLKIRYVGSLKPRRMRTKWPSAQGQPPSTRKSC